MFAAGSGLADCVRLLATQKADFTKVDRKGRGCMQLASKSQGEGQILANWIYENVENAGVTNARGRDKEDQTRGAHSSASRSYTGPVHYKRRGYEPQEQGRSEGWSTSYEPHNVASSSAAPADLAADEQWDAGQDETESQWEEQYWDERWDVTVPFTRMDWHAWRALWRSCHSRG